MNPLLGSTENRKKENKMKEKKVKIPLSSTWFQMKNGKKRR